tara:strand:+ start:6964 stop:7917 length:954 start_codon:yes stop_codon:yes gene_type:complete
MNKIKEIDLENLKKCIVCDSKEINFLCSNKAMMHTSNKKFNFFICKICNLVFLNPRLPLSELKKYYTDYYLPYRGPSSWGKYEKFAEISQRRLDIRRVKILKKHSTLNSDSIILDIGCGNPTFLKTCSHFFKSSLIGIDFSDNGWKNEQEKFQNLNLIVGEIDDLEKNLYPDAISLWHYLEHDYYPNITLKKLASISNSKTKLYIEVPNYDSSSRKKYNENWGGFHTPRHTFLFSPNNIEIILKKNGWSIDSMDLKGSLNPYILTWMSDMEIKDLDWRENLENEFINFVLNMIKYKIRQLFKTESEGIMTIVARKTD